MSRQGQPESAVELSDIDVEVGTTPANAHGGTQAPSSSGRQHAGRTPGRTWAEYLASIVISREAVLDADSGEEHERVRDSVQDHDGYQLASWEEVRFCLGITSSTQEAELTYQKQIEGIRKEDFSDVADFKFLTVPCHDKHSRPVVLIVARHLPANIVDAERLYRFAISRLDAIVDAPYSVVYVHTRASYWENCPSASWLRSAYERLPVNYKRKLLKFYILHSDLTLWLSMLALCPFMSHGFWGKVSYVPRVEFLWDDIDKRKLEKFLPKFVHKHDEILEEQPLHDYGYVDTTKEMPMPGMPME